MTERTLEKFKKLSQREKIHAIYCLRLAERDGVIKRKVSEKYLAILEVKTPKQ